MALFPFPTPSWGIISVTKWLGSPPFISQNKAIWKGTKWDPPSLDILLAKWNNISPSPKLPWNFWGISIPNRYHVCWSRKLWKPESFRQILGSWEFNSTAFSEAALLRSERSGCRIPSFPDPSWRRGIQQEKKHTPDMNHEPWNPGWWKWWY